MSRNSSFFVSRSSSSVVIARASVSAALALGLAAVGTWASAAAPEKIVLQSRAEVGQIARYQTTGTLDMEAGGQKFSFEFKQTDKDTVKSVDKKTGDVTFESVTESEEMSVNGEKQEADEDDEKPDTETYTIHSDGSLVSYLTTAEDKTQAKSSARQHQASSPVFPKTAVGAGDKWTHEFKANADLGTKDATGNYEALGFEKIGGVECVKIKVAYAEKGDRGMTSRGTIWVEKASGDVVTADVAVENVPFGGDSDETPVVNGKIKGERTEGGPLPGGSPKTTVAQASPAAPPKPGTPPPPAKPGDAKIAVKTTDAKPAEDKKAEEKKPEAKKEKTIDEVVKDYEKIPGLVTLWRKKDAGRDTLYVELREDQLNQLMMLETTAATGTADQIAAGDPISDLVFKFTRSADDKIYLTVPNYSYRTTNKELARALKRSFPEGYIQAFKIEAKQPDRKTLLLDVSDLFRGDIAGVSQAFSGGGFMGMGGGGSMSLDREKTFVLGVKNFPDNLVVTSQYHFMKGLSRMDAFGGSTLADPRSAPITVVYNLFALPENGYQPRRADARIGYFTTEYQSFDDDAKDDQQVRNILRWDLKKKDPTAAVSEPVKPLVFWLDNAIPLQYRDAVRDGILAWNKAFEKIGIKNAIVVKQMADDADPNDHADMRFNTIRWVVSPDDGYAVALFRANPITGQILNANITVDANIVRVFKVERKDIVDPAVAFQKGAGVDIEDLMAVTAKTGAPAGSLPLSLRARLSGDPRRCQIGGAGMREQAWFGYNALSLLSSAANPLVNERDYANELVKETVAHEMGHILGLRHNFVGSTEFSLAELSDPATVAEGGIGASVMDYNPFNIAALKKKGVHFYSQSVGSYDNWAIQYGYTPVPGNPSPDGEKPVLNQIARRSNEKGHAYQSDEMVMAGFDPMVLQYDLSSDPIAYWTRMLQTSRYLLVNLDKRLPRQNESYYEFTKAFSRLLGLYARSAGTASRFIGGLNVNRNHRGDPGEKPTLTPISLAQQKQALDLLNTYIFSPTALRFPDRYFGKMTSNPWDMPVGGDFPIGDQIANVQRTALRRLFSPTVLTRMANSEFKTDGDAARTLTLPALFKSVSANVWAEIDAKKNVPTLRRQLQRAYLDTMLDMALGRTGSAPEDAKMLAWDQLRQLQTRLSAAKASSAGAGWDDYTRVHVDDSLTKVTRALDAKIMLGGSQPAAGPSLLQMLLSGDGKAAPSAGSTQPAPAP